MEKVTDLLRMSGPGIYCIRNPKNGKAYIVYSSGDMLASIAGVMSELKDRGFKIAAMNKDRDNLVVEILENGGDIETLKLHVEYWINQYQLDGWTLYDPARRKYLQYKVVVEIPLGSKKFVEVVLKNTRNDMKIVGRFKDIEEANMFISECYGEESNPFRYPVYANNSLTREYLGSQIRGMIK